MQGQLDKINTTLNKINNIYKINPIKCRDIPYNQVCTGQTNNKPKYQYISALFSRIEPKVLKKKSGLVYSKAIIITEADISHK